VVTTEPPLTGAADRPRREKRMSLGQHLVELRKRLMIAALALVVGMVVAFFITDWVIWMITEPLRVIAETEG
jgi:sec-independent protein translocase protein TatC